MEATAFAQAISPWTTGEHTNLTAHLSVAIRHAIAGGLLQRGERLPPERAMAEVLHVSRPTISAVIDDLRRGGFVSSRQGSGSWIAQDLPKLPAPIPFNEQIYGHGLIDLAAATAPDAGMLPAVHIDEGDLLATIPANGLALAGLESVRSDIAAHLRQWHSWVEPDNVVVTSGAHHALAMLITTLVPRGASVLVEDVTYGGLIDLLRSNGVKPVGVQRDSEGVDPKSLQERIRIHSPAMIIIVSSVHSPSGRVSSDQRNADLAKVLGNYDGHVVIDETYADLEFTPTNRTLGAALDNKCMIVGSLSKTAWLGLRTGWIASADTSEAITALRWAQFDLGPSVPSQLIAQQILQQIGDLRRNRREQLIERAQWLSQALGEKFPDWELTPPQGGLALWAKLPGDDSTPFAEAAAERGVAVLTGSACRADRGTDPHLRLCFDRPINLLEEAVDRL